MIAVFAHIVEVLPESELMESDYHSIRTLCLPPARMHCLELVSMSLGRMEAAKPFES